MLDVSMKKILFAAYFIILFVILGSYLGFSAPDLSLRMKVTASPTLSSTYPNVMLIQVDDARGVLKDKQKRIEFTVEEELADGMFRTISKKQENKDNNLFADTSNKDFRVISQNEDVDYKALYQIPYPGQFFDPRFVGNTFHIQLFGDKDKESTLYKDVRIHCNSFDWEAKDYLSPEFSRYASYERRDLISVVAPAAFMMGQPNEVLLVDIKDGDPFAGDFIIEQINVFPVPEPMTVHADPSGVTSVYLTIQAQTDYKITAGDDVFYASFVPLEKPFHAEISDHNITSFSFENPKGHVTPSGSPHSVIIDYFVGDVWIDRQIVPSEEIHAFKLTPKLNFTILAAYRYILYARLSYSEYATEDTSQTFAILATKSPLKKRSEYERESEEFGAIYHTIDPNFAQGKSSDYLKSLENTDPAAYALARPIAEAMKDKDEAKLKQLKKYLYSRLASQHHPQLKLIANTDDQDKATFEENKHAHHLMINRILVFWFVLGICAFGLVAFITHRRNRQAWFEAKINGDVDRIPTETPKWLIFVIALLLFGLMISLYYMMQLI